MSVVSLEWVGFGAGCDVMGKMRDFFSGTTVGLLILGMML